MEIDHASPSTALSPSEPVSAAAATPAALSAMTSLDEEAPLVTVTHHCTGAQRGPVLQRSCQSDPGPGCSSDPVTPDAQ